MKRCKGKCRGSDSLLKFSGNVGSVEFGADAAATFGLLQFLADTGGGPPLTSPVGYPLGTRRTFRQLTVSLGAITLTRGQALHVELLRNGSPTGLEVVFAGTGGVASGVQTATQDVSFDAQELLDLRVTSLGLSIMGVAATLQ